MTKQEKKQEEKYLERLLQFLDYISTDSIQKNHKVKLRSANFVNYENGNTYESKVVYFYSVLVVLANIFDVFSTHNGELFFYDEDNNEEYDYLNGTMIFLGLNDMDEFMAVFDAGGNNSCEKFGTRKLLPESSLLDIAFNLHQIIQYKRGRLESNA